MAAQSGDELPASRSGIVGKITVQNILDLVPESSTLVQIACKNTSGGTITVGTPVYQTGTVGATATIEVAPADALISAGNYPAIGLLKTTLANNDTGFVVITGELTNIITSPIDGAVPTVGDTVYLKSGGGLTLTKPTGEGNAIQNMGLVGKVSTGTSGSITVSSVMRANDVPNLPTGKIWVGDSNTAVSDTVFVDEPNLRLGIGTITPSVKLHVEGDIKTTNALISNQQNTDVDTGTETVAEISSTTYTAAFFDYVIKNGTNVRAGIVSACHDGTTNNIEYNEVSTNDLGDTSDVTLSVDISGGNIRLLATTTSDNWSIKSLVRGL